MVRVRFASNLVYRLGASLSLATPILLNLVISQRSTIDIAAAWLVTLAVASWVRMTFNSKGADIFNRFGESFAPSRISVLSRLLLFRELIFTLVQVAIAVGVLLMQPHAVGLDMLIFAALFIAFANIRDLSVASVRVRRGEGHYYRLLWVEGIARVVPLSLMYLLVDLNAYYVSLVVLLPIAFHVPQLVRESALSDDELEGAEQSEINQYFLVSQVLGTIKSGYQNLDMVVVPMFLHSEALWVYLTSRQLLVQALSMGLTPITNSRIPLLMKKQRGLSSREFYSWLARSRSRFCILSLVVYIGMLSLLLLWLSSREVALEQYLGVLFSVSLVGIIRANLWWNKDVIYSIGKWQSVAISLICAGLAGVGLAVSMLYGTFEPFLAIYCANFFLISLHAEYLTHSRLGRSLGRAQEA